jgi:S1-C subfamily serine protease
VVSIYTTSRTSSPVGAYRESGGRIRSLYGIQQGMGSGVLLSEDGYILTNHHVISQVQRIQVELFDGRSVDAELVGSDPETDIAVLKINLDDVPVVPVADQPTVAVGDVVLAIGNAVGLSHTVTMGIVSATGRTRQSSALYDRFIQTDAAINFGNSGGALVNARGELIGINTRLIGRTTDGSGEQTDVQNIGFAIPITQAREVMQEIIDYGAIRRGWIGANFSNVRPQSRPDGTETRMGIAVQEVYRDGPAWLAGIRPGDVILELNDELVDDVIRFRLNIAETEPGSMVELDVIRGSEIFTTYATLIQQPPVSQELLNSPF